MSEYPKTDALIRWFWNEHARLETLERGRPIGLRARYGYGFVGGREKIMVSHSENVIRGSSDSHLMTALLMIGARINQIMMPIEESGFFKHFPFPELVYPFGNYHPAPAALIRQNAERKGRAINWRTVVVVKTALLSELNEWLASVGREKEFEYFQERWKSEDQWGSQVDLGDLIEPEVDLLHVNDLNQAHKDYSSMSARLFNPRNRSLDEEGLEIFKLIDPIAEQLDFSAGYRGDQIIGFNYSSKKPFLLFNPERERYARCGFTYMLNHFRTNKAKKKNMAKKKTSKKAKSPGSGDFKQTLWKSADKLRAQMDAAEYKHIVLGLIFLKYISDTFVKQQEKIREMVSDPSSDFFISEEPSEYEQELEERDYYIQDNVFWVPQEARWEMLRSKAKQPDISSLIDDAMTAIENENPILRGKLDKRFGRSELGQGILGELIDLISTIGFAERSDSSDLLGEVYEYFLGQFAVAEGRRGGQFYTPSHVVKTLVAVLSPTSGRVYDPCCGSGGMFVQSEEFVKAHGGRLDDISIYGQESNPTTWRLAAMNLAIRGFAADLGKEPADTFGRDQFPDVKFDYIMANPPFNISDWGGEKYEDDVRWKFGRPPVGNANYAWLQHMFWKLRPGGQAGVVLANGSMGSNTGGEGQIREAMVRGDLVEVMVAMPEKLFVNTGISVCLWFLTNDKTMNGRDRKGETLFIDARQLGTMETRVLKVFTDEDIAKIQDTVQSWKRGEGYEDVAGFCKSASLEEIEKNGFALTPGRYVGAELSADDGIDFNERIEALFGNLSKLSAKSAELDEKILSVKSNFDLET